jgi:hypothetical protein
MKRIVQAFLLLLILLASTTTLAATRTRRMAATCVGATPCRACKNCRYCKHCAQEGGTCGVCRRRRGVQDQGSWEEARQRLTQGGSTALADSLQNDPIVKSLKW